MTLRTPRSLGLNSRYALLALLLGRWGGRQEDISKRVSWSLPPPSSFPPFAHHYLPPSLKSQGEAGRRFSNALNSKDDKGLTMKLVDKLKADEQHRRKSMAAGLSQFAEKMLAEARKVFNMIDKDGTGSIELPELNLLLLALGKTLPHDELVAAQRSLDLDGSGTVDFEEFMVWYGSLN